MASDYRSRASASQQLAFGLTYSLQAYRGGNMAALQAVPDGHRKVATIYGSHALSLSPKLTVGYGARYEHYDYLGGHGLLSPSARASFAVTPSTQVYARASVRNVAPGAEEFVPPADAWVPPQRTFAPLAGERFDTEQVRHVEGGVSRRFGETTMSAAAFFQTVDDQLVTVFGAADPERLIAAGGHYGVASAGDAVVRGWRVGMEREFLPNVRGRAVYTTSSADWTPPSRADRRALRQAAPEALTPDERIHDLSTSLDAEVPQTDTRLIVLYKLNSAFAEAPAAVPGGNARFDVQLRQGLPLTDRVGDWEMLIGVRSLFRSSLEDRSVYDELLVVRAPKRVTCGLQVRF
jgi:outer membrane receptor protein involved in Fe transport